MTYKGKLLKGHQVASGKADDPRCPNGTIAAQKPFFKNLGFSLDDFHNGTLNISFEPLIPTIIDAKHKFEHVQWHPDEAAETFSFIPAKIHHKGEMYAAYVYYPHPETKPDHFQPLHVLEFIAPWIANLPYDSLIQVEIEAKYIQMEQG